MSDVDGYIEFTITGRYPVTLAGYFYPDTEGDVPITSLDQALDIDRTGYAEGMLTGFDFIDFADHDVDVTLKAVPNG